MASLKPICAGVLLAISAAPVAVYAQATRAFDLPAQALASSLREFGSQSHINVMFDPATVGGRQAPAVKGHYEPRQALAKLLEGTGFTAEFTGATTVVIKPLHGNGGKAVFRGVYEDNDPSKRLMMMINYNTDISQYWEWSGRGLRPFDETNEAYKLGVNYIIYGLTH